MRSIGIAAIALGIAQLIWAQSNKPEDLAQGKLLVMEREAPDPLFAHSVIELVRYGKTGALGLMLHFRSDIPIAKALDGVKGAEKRTDPIFVGGPVEMQGVMALLHSDKPPGPGADLVTGKLYLVASKQSLAAALAEGRKPAELRIFLGYAGWGPGQLEREVRAGGWYIFDYDEKFVFDEHPETLWKRMIDKTDLQKVMLRLPVF
jgi:putative transcriptional regulator